MKKPCKNIKNFHENPLKVLVAVIKTMWNISGLLENNAKAGGFFIKAVNLLTLLMNTM